MNVFKKTTVVFAVFVISIIFTFAYLTPQSAAAAIIDIPENAWYESAVTKCIDLQIIDGFPDGTFRANEKLTAGQFLKMLAFATNTEPSEKDDIHWAQPYWEDIYEYIDLISLGIECTYDALEAPISRYNMAALVDVFTDEEQAIEQSGVLYDFEDIPEMYLQSVLSVFEKGIITGCPDGEFKGAEFLTRAEGAVVIIRMLYEDERVAFSPSIPSWNGTFDSKTLLIGDSLTCHLVINYLRPNNLEGEVSYMAAACTGLYHYFSDQWTLKPTASNVRTVVRNDEFYDLPIYKAVENSAGRYDKIFFLLGSNGSASVTQAAYEEIVDHLLLNYPNATIYLQTVPNSPAGVVKTTRVNTAVKNTVESYSTRGIENVVLLNTNGTWDSSCIAGDSVHLTNKGAQKWYEFIVETLKQ